MGETSDVIKVVSSTPLRTKKRGADAPLSDSVQALPNRTETSVSTLRFCLQRSIWTVCRP